MEEAEMLFLLVLYWQLSVVLWNVTLHYRVCQFLLLPAQIKGRELSKIKLKQYFLLLDNYFLEIETIRLKVMLTRKSKICCSVDKKGACVYMCYIWFCSVINFVWKKCKKFNVIQEKWKWRIGFLTVLYCYIAVAIGFNILMWLSFFFPYCSASIIVTVRTTDFYFQENMQWIKIHQNCILLVS